MNLVLQTENVLFQGATVTESSSTGEKHCSKERIRSASSSSSWTSFYSKYIKLAKPYFKIEADIYVNKI